MKAETGRKAPLFFSMTWEFLEEFLPRQCGRSLHTVESYRDALSLFRRYVLEALGMSIGSFTFAQCTRDCVIGFIKYLEANRSSATTRNHRLAALKSYVAFAADKDVGLASIALIVRRIPHCRAPRREHVVIPEVAMATILQQPVNSRMGLRDRTIMILMYDSGARVGEILGLRVSDLAIGTDNPYIRIHGKGGKQRVVPITVKTGAHLIQYLEVFHGANAPDTEWLFYTVIKGSVAPMSEGNVERFINKYAEEARDRCDSVPEKVHPHMFRRTRATQLYQNGVSLPLVSRILGHASLQTTQLYAKPSIEMLREAIESVESPEQDAEKPLWVGDEAVMARLSGLR